MGRTAWAVVGFEHHHIETMTRSQGPAAEPPQAAANNDQIRLQGSRACTGSVCSPVPEAEPLIVTRLGIRPWS